MEMEDQNLILMKNEGKLSQRGKPMNLTNVIDKEKFQENANGEDGARIALEDGLQKYSNAKCVEEGGEAYLSQDKEKTIIGLNEEECHLTNDVKK